MKPTSQFFQALADLLRLVEGLGAPTDQYGVTDGGETLELSKALHTQLKDTPEFQSFEAQGGNCYCYDDNEWEVI